MNRRLSLSLLLVLGCAILGGFLFVTVFHVRLFIPRYEYAHVRMRIFTGTKEIDVRDVFSGYTFFRGACSGVVQSDPFGTVKKDPHSIRLMWKGLTGRDVFMYLGIRTNKKPQSDTLGYAFHFPQFTKIVSPSRAISLPEATPETAFIFVRSGDGFIERSLSTWLHGSLETNLGRNSQIKLSWFSSIAFAHEEETEINTSSANPFIIVQEQEEARVLNNILGDMVIFLNQNTRPTNEEIEAIFNSFPLITGGLCDEAT
jgi:hypothetical protein